MPADLAIINANIKTMNPLQPTAEALAIRKNLIAKIGTNRKINQLIGKGTEVIDLKGKTVVPGLIDTHVHVADFGRCLLWLDLTCAESIKQLQKMLKEKAMQTPSGKWIIGRGWNQSRFKEKRFLNLADLDAVVPNNPVILYHEAALICAVNTKALEAAGVTSQTQVPSGGTVDKDTQTGELTGIFRESATNLVWHAVPEPDEAELLEATALACQKIAEAGLTSVNWLVLSENELPIIQQLHKRQKFPLRINVIIPEALLEKIVDFQSADPSMLRLGGVMIDVDGYLDSKTAALSKPYSDDPKNSGKLQHTLQSLSASVAKVLSSGLQPVLHAMGDKAVDLALKVIEQNPDRAIRFHLEQAALLNPQLVGRLKKLNVVVSVQPRVIVTEFAVWSAVERLGMERARWLHPLKTLLEADVKVAGGSDCPMEPLSPLLGMQDVVQRQSFPEQRLTAEEALRMYTFDAGYALGEETVKGSIETGKLADLTILSDDPTALSRTRLKTLR